MTGSGAASISALRRFPTMERMSDSTAGLILAAGRSTRFGANKLLADVDGRPMLQHVLDLAAAAGLDSGRGRRRVPVTRPSTPSLTWRGEQVVVNPDPERGLSSSVQARIGRARRERRVARRRAARRPAVPDYDQVRRILATPDGQGHDRSCVPRYAGRPGNPVVLDAFGLAARRVTRRRSRHGPGHRRAPGAGSLRRPARHEPGHRHAGGL